MKKCVIIYNEKSGKNKSSEVIDNFYKIIEANGYSLEVIITKRRGHATDIMKNLDDDVDLVIAAGGDGTFNEVIKGNIERKKKLLMAHLPLGTTNDVGSMYGFSKDYKKDLLLILNGIKKNIDILMINNNPFVYIAAYGNFINVTYDTPKKWKEKLGRLAYILYGITEIKEKLKLNHIKFYIDGKEYEGDYSYIFITNTNRVGGVSDIYDDIKLDDNKFEVLFSKFKRRSQIVRALHHLKKEGANNIKHCEYFSASNLTIIFDEIPNHSWGLDGEEYKAKTKKYVFSINKEISILLPKENIDKLFEKEE